jgi:hypothetical protein
MTWKKRLKQGKLTFASDQRLKKYLGMNEKEMRDYLRYVLFKELGSMRSVCCIFKFDMALYAGRKDLIEYFTRLCRDIFYICPNKDEKMRYLGNSNGFYSVNHMNGWFLEAQLRAFLKRNQTIHGIRQGKRFMDAAGRKKILCFFT